MNSENFAYLRIFFARLVYIYTLLHSKGDQRRSLRSKHFGSSHQGFEEENENTYSIRMHMYA